MKYTIRVYSIFEQGKYRSNQEDCIFPDHGKAKDSDTLFMLCDGMGGHEKGEVASRIVCDEMSRYITCKCSDSEMLCDSVLFDAVNHALDALDDADTGEVKKMGTTMTLLKLHDGGATIAHIGDSRVYQIRPSKNGMKETQIVFQTQDHSLVNELVRAGEMTEEEAKDSKQKNVITRAMMPKLAKRPKADVCHLSDVRSGDYFFLCSDGMLDQMSNDNLRFIFSKPDASDQEKVEMLKGASVESRDNHSAYIIHIL